MAVAPRALVFRPLVKGNEALGTRLQTSGNCCYQSPPFRRPRDQKKRRHWGREWQTGKKCCEQQLRRVDKALSRAGDIPEGSWICLSHRNFILAEENAVPVHLRGDTVKSYQNVRSLRGYMQYLTRWEGTALPNTSLGQTGVTNAASSQIKNSRPTPCSLPGSKKKSDIKK